MKKKTISFLLLITLHYFLFAQTAMIPEVGKRCPDFKLTNVTYFTKMHVSLDDFKGKWLLLDFWFTGCTSCIKSFPKINGFQQQLSDKAQFLLIGINDKKRNSDIQEVFEKLRKKQTLNLAAAYDSVLSDKWDIHSMPHIIIIDPQGIVRHITGGRDMTIEKLNDMIDGKTVSFYPKDIDRPDFNPDKLGLVNTNSADDKLIYRSILTKWNGEKQSGGFEIDRWVALPEEYLRKGYNLAMVPLYGIYNYAYFGQWTWLRVDSVYYGNYYPRPLMEIRDSSLFDFDYSVDVGKGLYNYNLMLPPDKVSKENVMKEIQADLKRVLSYDAYVETREMPAWKLVAAPGAMKKLITKGGAPYCSCGDRESGYKSVASVATGFSVRNQPVRFFLSILIYMISESDPIPYIDATGITGNIDITIDADLNNFQDIRKELQKNGLDFVKGTKQMKVLVIRDPKN